MCGDCRWFRGCAGWGNRIRLCGARFYLCLLVVCGYGVAAGLARDASRVEIAGLTLCMGPAIMGFCLILFSMLGIRPAKAEILAIAAVLAMAGIAVHRFARVKRTPESRSDPTPAWWLLICAIAIGYGLMSIANDVLMYPVNEWDAFAIWQLKAKVLAIYALHPQPAYFTNLSLSYSHLRYPLLAPMISAGMHAMTGSLDDLCKTISLLLYPGMGLAVFAAVKRINGTNRRPHRHGAAGLSGTLLPLRRIGNRRDGDHRILRMQPAVHTAMAQNRDRGFLILAAIFSGWMAWTKNEGLALAAINAIVVAASGPCEQRRKSLAAGDYLGGYRRGDLPALDTLLVGTASNRRRLRGQICLDADFLEPSQTWNDSHGIRQGADRLGGLGTVLGDRRGPGAGRAPAI